MARAKQEVHLFVDGNFEEKNATKDTLQTRNYARKKVESLVHQGFFFAGVDSVKRTPDLTSVYLHKGAKVKTSFADAKNKNPIKFIKKRLLYLGENGYPFAVVSIDSLQLEAKVLNGSLVEQKGPLIRNDSCFFFSEIDTKHSFIYQLLDHIPGENFNEKNYQSISKKIGRYPFLSLKRAPDLSFQDKKAKLYLDVQESEMGSFQGILGLQQNVIGRSEVVGSFDLQVQNLFRSGKVFEINWERFRENSQELSVSYSHPFVLGSKISPIFRLDLLKQDTVFLQRNTGVGFSVFVSPKVALDIEYVKRTGTLLATSEQVLLAADLADFESDLYQLKIKQGRFRDLSQLISIHAWEASIAAGQKNVLKNLSVPDTFYDTIAFQSNVFQFDFAAAKNFQLKKRLILNQSIKGGVIQNQEILNNERYRLGGLNSLRGFDEKAIFADRYLLSKTELRSFFEKGSFLFAFYDQLLFKNDAYSEAPFGTGFGFSLATSSGQFSFAVALGKSKAQRADFSRAKAHFGYITRF